MSNDLEREALVRYLEDHHLKRTRQREAILDVFLKSTGHISSDQLHDRVRDRFPGIGSTTVYRTMKILCDAGLAVDGILMGLGFGNGRKRCFRVGARHENQNTG